MATADPTWAQAPAGVYRYAVSTVYPDGSESAKVVLPYYIARQMTGKLSLKIRTNSHSGDAFAMASAGEVGWQYRDADGSRTFAEQEFDFPGRTQPGSFMVFNPWLTTPSMADARSASLPYSGKQELACFAGRSGSDDWFISPRLTYHNDYTFSFYARGYSQTYGEVIRVGYSMTDTDPESFTWLAENVDVPKQTWTEFKYTVPAGARYVAVNCVSPDGFTLFMDNVTISGGNDMAMNTAVSGPEVTYEVSLDGEKLADTEDCSYMLNPGAGEHYAEIKAVYASGESAPAKILFGESGVNGGQTDKISVWPNPAPGYTNVRGEFKRVVLYDLSGRVLRAFDGSHSRLEFGGVQSGVYLLVIEPLSGKPQTVKLTVK